MTACKHCGRESERSARAVQENPFCSLCHDERVALSKLRRGRTGGVVVTSDRDGYVIVDSSRPLTAPERRELLAVVKRERAKREVRS